MAFEKAWDFRIDRSEGKLQVVGLELNHGFDGL